MPRLIHLHANGACGVAHRVVIAGRGGRQLGGRTVALRLVHTY
ncbi:hypothetical protein SLI_1741 [Streptomyces lividans 1326]|uniref:Uncharacterized protein n=1 Tax=Streptomyces lividans 1326 TaxID=1200984 RepID=A0A7U9DM14_STRLI|nr:hypothetical protein SLI_1741 [Streptomyces lividans 1326]